ncbi:MAG: polysaccharide pyruvyl transferase family protein [Clostridia bacterium]|nr:polysaccharide pyruvyl transferase family protein [Clostridia bacterium]
MKKVGMLTFHASHNYGSVLQAYALSKQMKLMGHSPEFINLRPQSQKNTYTIFKKSDSTVRRLFKILIYPALKKRFLNFERFINKVLPITPKEYKTTEELRNEQFNYAAYVCGGDQIWNPCCQDFETAYYLQFLDKDNKAIKCSYSPSFGKVQFDDETKKKLKEWIKTFDKISVREQSGAELLSGLTDKKVDIVCDPVVLLERKYWDEFAIAPKYKKPYILVYFLENNHGSRDLIDYLHKTLGYEVVLLNEYIRDFVKPYHKKYSASPEEFVGLFKNAAFVYTNSFHGTAFATIFNKPFITAIAKDQENAKNNNDSRKIDFLNNLGLQDRLYTDGLPEKDFLTGVNFENANQKLNEYRSSSMGFLKEVLNA